MGFIRWLTETPDQRRARRALERRAQGPRIPWEMYPPTDHPDDHVQITMRSNGKRKGKQHR
jgi:hypothetical protein